MEYNKREFNKVNNKKVLHKVKKQWIVLSSALLLAIGGEAVVQHPVHASLKLKNPNTSVTTQQQKQGQQNNSQSHDRYYQQASQLHKNIMANQVKRQSMNYKPVNNTYVHTYVNQINQEFTQNKENMHSPRQINVETNKINKAPVRLEKSNDGTNLSQLESNNDNVPTNPPTVPTSNIQASGLWGTSHWILDNQGDLYLNGGDLNDHNHIVNNPDVGDIYSDGHGYNLTGHDGYAPYANVPGYTIPSNLDTTKVEHIYTYNNVKAPEEAEGLFANNSDNMSATPGVDYNTAGFGHFNHLLTADLSGMDMSDVFSTKDMFRGDHTVQKITGINNHNDAHDYLFDTSAMFYSDYDLSDVDISKLDTISNTWIDNMFMNDYNLKSLDLSNFDTRRIMDHDKKNNGSFEFDNFVGNTKNLKTVTLGKNTIIDANTGLSGNGRGWIHIQNGNASVANTTGGFIRDPGTWSAVTNTSTWNGVNWYLDNQGDLILKGTPSQSITADMPGDLASQKNNVKYVYTLGGFKTSTKLINTFSGMHNLQFFDGSGMDMSNVNDISGIFMDDYSLAGLEGLKTWFNNPYPNLQSMNGAFKSDKSLQTLKGLSDWRVGHINGSGGFENTFRDDTALTNTLDISNWNTGSTPANSRSDVSMGDMFTGDNNLEMIKLTSSDTPHLNHFIFGRRNTAMENYGEPDIPSQTWINTTNGKTTDNMDQERTPGLYFNTQNCVPVTVNYKFGSKNIYTYNGWTPKVTKGSNLPGKDIPALANYELDPRLGNPTYHFTNNEHTDIQLDLKGTWCKENWDLDDQTRNLAPAKWDLTPDSDDGDNNPITKEYGYGNLYVHDGVMFANADHAQHNDLLPELGMNTNQSALVRTLTTNNDSVPVNSQDLFDEEDGTQFPNLTSIDVSGIDASRTNTLWAWFCGEKINQIKGLNTLNTDNINNYDWAFASMPNLRLLDLSNLNTHHGNSSMNNVVTNTPLNEIKLGDSTFLGSNFDGGTQQSVYAKNNPMQIINNIEDGQNHSGDWQMITGHVNVDFKFGNSDLGTKSIPVSNNQIYSSQLQTSKNGINYELDPRIPQNITANANSTVTVQMDATGKFGSATWDLTPDNVQLTDKNGQKLPKGNLYIHDGTLVYQPNGDGSAWGSFYRATGMNQAEASDVHSISTNNAIAPSNSQDLFNDEDKGAEDGGSHYKNLTTMDLSGLDMSNAQDSFAMIAGFVNLKQIKGLNKWNTPNLYGSNAGNTALQWMFWDNPQLQSIDLSHLSHLDATGNSGIDSDLLWDDNALQTITMGQNTSLNNNANLTVSTAINPNNPQQLVNLEDGQPHPGTWQIAHGTANITLKYGNATLTTRSEPVFNNKVYPVELTFNQNGINYELDPRANQPLTMNNGGDYTVQLDKTGKWNQATWDLTGSDVDNVTNQYGKGNLYIHDGAISDQENGAGQQSGIWNVPVLKNNINNIQSINFHKVSTPNQAWNLFTYIPNLTSFSFKGLDTSQTSNFQGWFWSDRKLTNVDFNSSDNAHEFQNASDIRSLFWNDPALTYVDLSPINAPNIKPGYPKTGSDSREDNMFSGTNINKIKLGNGLILYSDLNGKGSPDLGNNTTEYGYLNGNSDTVTNLEDNKVHPGTWFIPTSDAVNFNDIYGNIDDFGTPTPNDLRDVSAGKHTINVPSGYAFVNPDGTLMSNPNQQTINLTGKKTFTFNVAPVWHGLTYKYYDVNKQSNGNNRGTLEFTHGSISGWNGSPFFVTNGVIKGSAEYATNVIFDKGTDASNVTNMSSMFADDPNLKYIDMSNLSGTNHVTNMWQAIANDKNLISANLNNMHLDSLTGTNVMFTGDSSLQKITFNNTYAPEITDAAWMFTGDYKLQYVDLSGLNLRNAVAYQHGQTADGKNNVNGEAGMFNRTPDIFILGKDTIFNTADGSNQHQWISYTNNTPQFTNLADGQSHQGTWTRDAELVHYMDNNTNRGNTLIRVNTRGSNVNINSYPNVPQDFHAISPNQVTVNGGQTNVQIARNAVNGYKVVYYNQNNQPVGSDAITGLQGLPYDMTNILNNLPNIYRTRQGYSGYSTDPGQVKSYPLHLINGQKIVPVYVLGNKADLNIKFNDVNNNNKTIDSDEFNGTNAIGDKITQISLPKGYHVANSLPSNYNLDGSSLDYTYLPQDIASQNIKNGQPVEQMKQTPIQVSGNSANVYVKYVNSDGKLVNGDYVSGYIGKQVRLSDISTDNSQYTEDNHDDLAYTFKPGNINYNNNGTEEMNDYVIHVHNTKQSDTSVKLIYINQNDKQVGYSDTINGTPGQRINDITNSDDGGESVPNGYELNPNINQSKSYTLLDNPSVVYLSLRGKSVKPYVNINRVFENNDGSDEIKSDKVQLKNSDMNGNEITIKASNYVPNNYSVDTSEPSFQIATINNNVTTPEDITFYYKQNSQPKAQPISIRYINQVGKVVKIIQLNGKYGQDKANNSNQSDRKIVSDNIPKGYIGQRGFHDYTFTNNPQNIDVAVIGRNVNYPLTIHQIVKDNDSNKYHSINKKVNISGKVGDSVIINPYNIEGQNIIPNINGHRCHAEDNNQSIIETLSNNPATRVNDITYLYQEDATPVNEEAIHIHYVTSDYINKVPTYTINANKYYEVDEESDNGITGNKFDIHPYLEDVPESVNSYNYDLASNIDNSSENDVIQGNGISSFSTSSQDIFIHVKSTANNNLIILS